MSQANAQAKAQATVTGKVRLPSDKYSPREKAVAGRFKRAYEAVTFPLLVFMLLHDKEICPEYRMTWVKKFRLGWRMYRNSTKVQMATSYKAHLMMAAKLLTIPKAQKGYVVECGSYLGGSAANLSLVCDLVDRDLIVYDSFEGLPAPKAGDKYAKPQHQGYFRGELDIVKGNIRELGVIERCHFRKGWFADTLPNHTHPIVAMFLDVDLHSSLHDCILHLWPHLAPRGYVFMDEYTLVDYCALFYSEKYWKTYFDAKPPGLIGIGTGVPLGQYFVGPRYFTSPFQTASSIAYTRKDYTGYWDYYPDEESGYAD